MIVRLNPGKVAYRGFTSCVGIVIAGTMAGISWTEPVGAYDFGRQAAAQSPTGPVSQVHYTGKKHRHPPRKRTRRVIAKSGRHLYPYPYYPPCPYYFPAYGTYPCFAQGYYPNPPYSYGFGFGGPFWGGGIFDDD
jgi:hypothetical protein